MGEFLFKDKDKSDIIAFMLRPGSSKAGEYTPLRRIIHILNQLFSVKHA
jgi:hypothetical protein